LTEKKEKKAKTPKGSKPKKAKKPKMLKNHVVFILDRSGSMESIRDVTISAFNEQVQSIKRSSAAEGQQTDVSLFTFSNRPDEPTFFTAPVESLAELTKETYRPDGGTALYDTMLEATRRLGNLKDANDPETAFLVIILSDGEENASHATGDDVAKRLEALNETKRWTFTYLGCSAGDLTKIRSMGISASNSRSFVATAAGVSGTTALNNTATAQYFSMRSAGITSSDCLYDTAEAVLNSNNPANATGATGTGTASNKLILPPGVDPTTDADTKPPTTT